MMSKRFAVSLGVVVVVVAGLLVSSNRLRGAERSLAEAMVSLEETAVQAKEVSRLRSGSGAPGSNGSPSRAASPEAIDEALRRSGIGPDRIAVFRTGQAARPPQRGQSNGSAPAGLTAFLELEGITLARLGEFLAMLDGASASASGGGPRWRAGRIDLDLTPGGYSCNAVLHLETP